MRDRLVRSHFCRPTESLGRGRLLGSFPCGNCTVCQYMTPANRQLGLEGKPDVKLFHYINCKTRWVIYALICPCQQVYIGQTTQELRKRIQKHLSTIALASRDARDGKTLTSVADHFMKKHGGKPSGLMVVGIDRAYPNIRGGILTPILLCKESEWIYRLDTVYPRGLNEELLFTGFLGH